VVRENIETLYAAVEEGELEVSLPRFVRRELEAYLELVRKFSLRDRHQSILSIL
jgi:hypothetical protein